MALRRFASDASLRLGLRIQAGLVAEQPNYFGLLTSRAFATGIQAFGHDPVRNILQDRVIQCHIVKT